MKILNKRPNNIEDIKKNINRSTIIIFLIIFFSTILGLNIINHEFAKKRAAITNQEIRVAQELYKSNLSEKLSIIASSTVFLDYLHSGNETRKNLYYRFFNQIASLKEASVDGMQILDKAGTSIFRYGEETSDNVSLQLCYLNQSLNPIIGDCDFILKIFFNKERLLPDIQAINHDIKSCKNCDSYNFFNGNKFGSFPIKSNTNLKLKLSLNDKNDNFFYIYLLSMSIALIVFGIWSWYHLSCLLNKHIADPIKSISNELKSDHSLKQDSNYIEEIQYLINEITIWKSISDKIQLDENNSKLGVIAAQLAHDVRSPLLAIGMIVKNLPNIPEDSRVTLRNATQRISDIANNFLSQYKKPLSHSQSSLSNEHILSLLENIVSEKRTQYIDRNININLSIDDNAWNAFSFVNPIDFKRVISNLVNNSIEAIPTTGYVNINLIKLSKYLRIEIIDNGCGIKANLIPKIITGISIGKKNGYGLGLSHALNKIKEWNGDVDIKSELSVGTEIGVNIPLSEEIPNWFKSFLPLLNNSIVCILDDEPYTHNLWLHRLKSIQPLFKSIKHFYKIIDAEAFLIHTKANDVVFLVDFDLGTDQPSGLEFIHKFKLQGCSTLITSRYDDIEIQQKCINLGVKIIPKNLIPYIPIF